MQFRCSDCGELFESHHTNYKHAKGFHPNENPEQSADKAKELDHCQTCQANRSYDPVAARTRDLTYASGVSNPALDAMNKQIESLKAQVEAAKQEKAHAADLALQIQTLRNDLAGLKPVPATT